MTKENGYVNKVGWRMIHDIIIRQEREGEIVEGYYLRHSRNIDETGYQKVRVQCTFKNLDDSWRIVNGG